MNAQRPMNAQRQDDGDDLERQLERLAAGDLDEPARGPLLAWLEQDARRWRLFGLVALEAQTWSQALGEWPASASPRAERCPWAPPPAAPASRPRRHGAAWAAALAASLLAAFGLGYATRGGADAAGPVAATGEPGHPTIERAVADDDRAVPREALPPEAVLASLAVRSGLPAGSLASVHIPLAPSEPDAASDSPPAGAVSDYVRQQWRRRGYDLVVHRRYMFARLADGTQVAVPVEQVSFQPIPSRVN
jgi:hypothetical protein